MFSFLREADKENGSPGPFSMRRLAASLCLLSAIGAAIFALMIISKALTVASNTAISDWKVYFPVFIPCLAFLVGCILLLFFTTWEDIKGLVSAVAKKG
jgi:peptidoglycan/LPS O-acetylase OafA/YrhL